MAIGGGEISRPDSPDGTLALDAEVVRLADVRRPRLVFLPTATADDPGYVSIVEEYYGGRFGCDVVPLPLFDRRLGERDTDRIIRSADIVYVGGGNTLRMMKLWRRRGIDVSLRRAASDGTVLAGISAGAICWCASGVSDSASFTTTGVDWDYVAVRGLGLIEVALCPHYDADPRRPAAAVRIAARTRRPVLGLDDCTALEVVDGGWRVISTREGSCAHLVGPTGDVQDLVAATSFRPLHDLIREPG